MEVLTAQVAQEEHLEADINGEVLDYHEDMEGDQVEAAEPDQVRVYATHEQMEASQTTGAESPLNRETPTGTVLDLETDSVSPFRTNIRPKVQHSIIDTQYLTNFMR